MTRSEGVSSQALLCSDTLSLTAYTAALISG
jgi:hypothetical protein